MLVQLPTMQIAAPAAEAMAVVGVVVAEPETVVDVVVAPDDGGVDVDMDVDACLLLAPQAVSSSPAERSTTDTAAARRDVSIL